MTIFVETLSEIEANIDTLVSTIDSNSTDRVWFSNLVKAGAVFYPYQFGRVIAFAPSRFIGYKGNSRKKHEEFVAVGIADGKDTNPAISKVVRSKPVPNEKLELAFQHYCKLIDVQPFKKKRSYWSNKRIEYAYSEQFSAIDDIDGVESGNDSPEYVKRMSGSFVRDPEVRRQVLRRADGSCEYNGCVPFQKADGQPYLETHHVISLSEQGSDKLSNVIALCANHHREAHFGANWKSLQDEFLAILKRN